MREKQYCDRSVRNELDLNLKKKWLQWKRDRERSDYLMARERD